MPNYKGFISKDSKSQPGKPGGHDGNYTGDYCDFNEKSKVTKNGGSYQDFGPGSGLSGNYSDKDNSMNSLKERGKKGIEVCNYTGTNEHSKMTIGSGPTAYDTRPIPETYKPATSNGEVDPNAVEYNTAKKNRNTK